MRSDEEAIMAVPSVLSPDDSLSSSSSTSNLPPHPAISPSQSNQVSPNPSPIPAAPPSSASSASSSTSSPYTSSIICPVTLTTATTAYTQDDASPPKPWHLLPDSLLLELFRFFDASDLNRVSLVCQNWLRVSRDAYLWRALFCRRWGLDEKTFGPTSSPALSSQLPRLCDEERQGWREEYIRLDYHLPSVESEVHSGVFTDEVLHVCFSPDGELFATASKDATVKVWSVGPPAWVKWNYDMTPHDWQYTQFCEFNSTSSTLLVSGVMSENRSSSSGEVAIFHLTREDFRPLMRLKNKPYDIFSAWFDERQFLTGTLNWMAPLVTCSTLCLNEVVTFDARPSPALTQASSGRAEPEAGSSRPPRPFPGLTPIHRPYRTFRLCEFWNENGSSVRNVLIASCAEHSRDHGSTAPKVSSPSTSSSTAASSSSSDRLLIFTTGSQTFTPHQIGIKRVTADLLKRRRPFRRNGWSESPQDVSTSGGEVGGENVAADESGDHSLDAVEIEEYSEEESSFEDDGNEGDDAFQDEGNDGNHPIQVNPVDMAGFEVPFVNRSREDLDTPDKVFEMHGHVIGLSLSPDHRYLYVNVRAWPQAYQIEEWINPPTISSDIEIHVIDLSTMESLGPLHSSHRAYTANNECFFIFLDVSPDWVASGAEDNHGHIWDRRFPEIRQVATLRHTSVVNSVAFNPVDQEMLVSVSDDHTLKIWRSRRLQKEFDRKCECCDVRHTMCPYAWEVEVDY